MRRRWPLLVLVLAPLLALWPGLTGLAVGPFDQIRHMPPWNGPKPEGPWDVLMVDSVLQSHVWRTLVLDAWGKGQLPLWNPYEFAGTPLLANSQSGGFYPPHIVLGLLHVSAGLAGLLLAWFHLALAGLGTYALVRRLGGSPAGGLTGGLLFALSPFMLGWTPLSSVVSTVAWIPLALACVADLSRSTKDQTLYSPLASVFIKARAPYKTEAALAACVGMMFLAGHLQFAAYGIMAIVLFALVRLPLSSPRGLAGDHPNLSSGDERGLGGENGTPLLSPNPLSSPDESLAEVDSEAPRRREGAFPIRSLLGVVAALALGAALAAPQLLPVLNYSKESHRRNVPTEEGYQAYIASALQPYELANLGHPMALGSPREPVEIGGTTVAAYWPALLRRNFAESAISLGAVALALLFAAPWRRRETWPLAALGGFALLLAFGTPLNRLFYFLIPGWSSTGSPGRVEVLFVLAACALAGLAVDRITERKAQTVAGLGLLVALLFAFVLPNLADAKDAAAVLRGAATAGVAPSLLVSLLLAAAALLLAKRSPWSIPAGAALVAVLTHATGLVPFGQPLDPPKGDPNVRIAVVNDAWDIVAAPPALLPPNLAALGGLHELSGYDSLTSRSAVEMLRAVNSGNDPAPPANGNLMFVKPLADPQELANWGVTEVWSRKELPEFGTPEPRDGYLVYRLEPSALTGGWVTGGTVTEGYDRIQVKAAAGGMIRVMDRLSDGWTLAQGPPSATFQRNPAIGWSIAIPQTKPTGFEATLRYQPSGMAIGAMLGVVSWAVLAILTVVSRRKRAT